MVQTVLTKGETDHLQVIVHRVEETRNFLCTKAPAGEDAGAWFLYLAALKVIQGNSDNDLSFLACLLAKRHLETVHGAAPFDVADKAQGASGLDIDFRTVDGHRIIGEVKTTTPYKIKDFGGQQWTHIRADIHKLRTSEADFKYLFVTDERAHEILAMRYSIELAGIHLVCLQP